MKGAFLELSQYRVERIDWGRLISELNAQGITGVMIADALGIPYKTLNNWKNDGVQPRYEHGATLLAIHARYAKK